MQEMGVKTCRSWVLKQVAEQHQYMSELVEKESQRQELFCRGNNNNGYLHQLW